MAIIVQNCDQAIACITVNEGICTPGGRRVCIKRPLSGCTDNDRTVTACTQGGKTHINILINYIQLSKFNLIRAFNDMAQSYHIYYAHVYILATTESGILPFIEIMVVVSGATDEICGFFPTVPARFGIRNTGSLLAVHDRRSIWKTTFTFAAFMFTMLFKRLIKVMTTNMPDPI